MGNGSALIRDAFNAVAQPRYNAHRAFLGYEQDSKGNHCQVISFIGAMQDGKAFAHKSELLPMNAEPTTAARAVATKLLQQGTGQ